MSALRDDRTSLRTRSDEDASFDALPVPAARCRRSGEPEFVNRALRDLLALPDDVGSCWDWFASDPSTGGLRSHVLRGLAATGSVDVDASALRADGTSIVVHASVREFGPDHLVLALRPIDSELRQAAKLRASQDRFEKLAGSVPAGIISSQAGMRVDYANQRCCEVFGVPAEVLFGFGWLDYVHRDDVDAVEEAVADAIASSREAHLPVRIQRADGTTRWAEIRIAPVSNARDIGFVATITDVTEARELTSLLTTQARHDPLTGLPNRTALRELLTARLQREGPMPAVLFVDLDHFKDVNDSLGHGAGDRLLGVVAHRLLRCVRSGDTVARFGGDEFVIVLEQRDGPGAAEAVAERVVHTMRTPIELAGHSTVVTASVGIVWVGGAESDVAVDVDAVLRDADIAMYQAKRAGRNRSARFDEQVRIDARQRLVLHSALRRALEQDDDELTLVYQPIVALGDGLVRGLEALMRWDLPGHGPVSPTTFIPLAEETGLIARLGRVALARALDDVARWRGRAGSEELWVSVNLSARDLVEPDLVAAVSAALLHRGLPGRALRLELTESAVMTDPEHAEHVLDALQRLGVSISVDDFGTGYSSLAYLQRLPLDAIKIDRAFVERIGSDASTAALVEAIIAVADALGLAVVAEGVETVEQAARLRSLGAEYAQGYLFSRPLPASAIDAGGRVLSSSPPGRW